MITNNISQFNYCFGCGVCSAVCPAKIITIELNEDGFWAPRIADKLKCTNCGLCLKVCGFAQKQSVPKPENISSFAVFSKSNATRLSCTSGGVAFELGKWGLSHNYKIIGCVYNFEKQIAEHVLINTEEELEKTKGSKYIQSNFSNVLLQIKKEDRYLCFGSPCQIDSLRRFFKLKRMEEQCIFIDFFCHGVPSYLAWQKYIQYQQKVNKLDSLKKVEFRNKSLGWHAYTILLSDGKKDFLGSTASGDYYYQLFLGDLCLNKPCYFDCRYKQFSSYADIRVGDLWGKKYKNDQVGISGVLVYSERGKNILDNLQSSCEIIRESLETITEGQMKLCPRIPSGYKNISKILREEKFEKIISFLQRKKIMMLPLRITKKLLRIINTVLGK